MWAVGGTRVPFALNNELMLALGALWSQNLENKSRYSLTAGGNFLLLPSQFLWSGVADAYGSGMQVISSDLIIGRNDHITS